MLLNHKIYPLKDHNTITISGQSFLNNGEEDKNHQHHIEWHK